MTEPMSTDGFEQRGRYWYRADTNSPYDWGTCVGCGKLRLIRRGTLHCSQTCAGTSRSGTGNGRWRGGQAGYNALHFRVHQQRGKAAQCVWGCASRRYEWANLTGNYDDIWDYAAMCKRCHGRFDGAVEMMDRSRDYRRLWRPGDWRYRQFGPPR